MKGVYEEFVVNVVNLVNDKEEEDVCVIPLPTCHCASSSLAVALNLPPNCFLHPETFSSSCYLETDENML